MTLPSFKEHVAADAAAFLKPDEFADEHLIDGQPMTVIVDRDELHARKAKSSNPTDGIHDAEMLFYADKSKIPARPVIGKPMKFDGRMYRVFDVQDDDPVMYTVILERTGS